MWAARGFLGSLTFARHLFVHGESGREDAGPRVRHAERVEQPLDTAVLAPGPEEREQDDVDRLALVGDHPRRGNERARRALDLRLEAPRELVRRLQDRAARREPARLLALLRGDRRVVQHERERIQEHDLVAVGGEACRDLRPGRE